MTTVPQDESGLRSFLEGAPSSAEAHAALGALILNRAEIRKGTAPSEDVTEAIIHLRDAVNLGHRTPPTIRLFIDTLRMVPAIPVAWNITEAFLHAFHAGVLNPYDFRPALAPLLNGLSLESGVLNAALDTAWRGDEQALTDILAGDQLRAILANPALTTLMRSILIGSSELEVLFTFARRHFLRLAAAPDVVAAHPSERAFCYALADQCFLSEYAFWSDPDEERLCDNLAETFSVRLTETPSPDPFPAAVLACYRPLASFSWADKLERLYTSAEFTDFNAIVERHIREPADDRRCATALPEVAEISNTTSLSVKQQYEENPYPRWAVPVLRRAQPFQNAIREKYPTADFAHFNQVMRPEILVAGCGTGQQILFASHGYDTWDLTAIDVSRASLAYAQRQIEKFDVPDIKLLVCDILDVGRMQKTFDAIECIGVLHHMADPLEGWRALAEVLRPGGVMTIGLYSALARRDVIAVQHYAGAQGYTSSAESIRQFRRHVLDMMRTPPNDRDPRETVNLEAGLRRHLDFYSISMCRDLIFHVQEKNFSLPEIAKAIAALGLTFLGFRFTSSTIFKSYCTRFPNDTRGDNLDNWVIFEQENPDTFASMYTFDVQKPIRDVS